MRQLSNLLSRALARTTIFNQRYFVKLRKITMDQKRVIVLHEPDSDSVDISFRFVSETPKVDRIFNLQRRKDELLSVVLGRISANMAKFCNKKRKKKGNATNEEDSESNISVTLGPIESSHGETELPDTISCYEAFVSSADKFQLNVNNQLYGIDLNPPVIKSVELPKCFLAGYPLAVSRLKTLFTDKDNSVIRWFKSHLKFESIKEANSKLQGIRWISIGEGANFSLSTSDEDVGCLLKVIITPYQGDRKGADLEAISSVLVMPGPGECPFDRRHQFTKLPAGENCLRVISYNILADLYADGEHARNVLFSTCPSHAMDLDYRKQLLVKELLGYKGDLICLQEVDEKVFVYDLEPALSNFDFEGYYDAKGGQVTEGAAIFFNKNKLRMLERNRFVLSEELQTNVLFTDMWEKLQQNQQLSKRVSQRTTVLQTSILESVEDPSRLILVGITHLYFHPNADHIRVLQGGICMQLLQQIVALYKMKHPEKEISLLFCGDFNSTPEFGIHRFMTTQLIDTDDVDWTSCPEECVKGISLHHDFEMDSACGLPSYTNYTVGFYGCLDYIFYQTDKFTVKKVIPMPSHEEVTEHTALPSITFPSDHLPLIADLEFRPR